MGRTDMVLTVSTDALRLTSSKLDITSHGAESASAVRIVALRCQGSSTASRLQQTRGWETLGMVWSGPRKTRGVSMKGVHVGPLACSRIAVLRGRPLQDDVSLEIKFNASFWDTSSADRISSEVTDAADSVESHF